MIDVSVLMPVYNASRYPAGWVERAIDSVLTQPEISAEVCIGDDGSMDGYLDRFNGDRIRITRAGEHPTGGSRAADAAAGIARGRYFCMVSCRSWYAPRGLTTMVRYLDAHLDIGMCWGDTIKYVESGAGYIYKDAAQFNPKLFMRSFPTSFGYLFRREAWDAGARYDCTVQTDEGMYISIGDHYMMAQLVQMGWIGAPLKGVQVLHYQYGHTPQAADVLAQYKSRLYDQFNKQLEVRRVEMER